LRAPFRAGYNQLILQVRIAVAFLLTIGASAYAGNDKALTAQPARRDGSATAPLPPRILPLANGKVLRLKNIGNHETVLEITVPPNSKMKMRASEESLPSAHITSAGLEIVVEDPEAGFATLTDEKAMIKRGDGTVTFLRDEETADGYLLIHRGTSPGLGPRYNVAVARPKLRVVCGAYELERIEDAERAAAICLTLRATAG